MNQHTSAFNKGEQTINSEQFTQIMEAIAAGKYSWACVLLLRFADYNPLHFIPYRTYKRLIKENRQTDKTSRQTIDNQTAYRSLESGLNNASSQRCLSQINDLSYQEEIDKQKSKVLGGNLDQWLNTQIPEYYLVKSELGQHN